MIKRQTQLLLLLLLLLKRIKRCLNQRKLN